MHRYEAFLPDSPLHTAAFFSLLELAGYLAAQEVEAQKEQQQSGVVDRYAFPANQPLRVAVRAVKKQAKYDWVTGPKYVGHYIMDTVSKRNQACWHKTSWGQWSFVAKRPGLSGLERQVF